MIHGIGTDIVSIQRIKDAISRFNDRFPERILAAAELEDYRKSVAKASFLAKRFAAKEAVVKALGSGFKFGISMQDIVVTHDDLGKPMLQLTGFAKEYLDAENIGDLHISISDERDYAVCFVTALVRVDSVSPTPVRRWR